MKWSARDHELMALALRLATRGIYSTHPNPRVGCVIARGGKILGEGWHVASGQAHAEVNALANANAVDTKGADCYVTLEPCCHDGRTGPCTSALIAAGVKRVVSATPDPNPKVSGKGIDRLKAAGITTEVGLLAEQAKALNIGFFKRMLQGRPYVRCKLAMSLDAGTAAVDGSSKWITSDAARGDVQRLRAEASAIMTGIGTVIADDPRLTVRGIDTGGRRPLRVVLDRSLRMPSVARMLLEQGRTLIFTGRSAADKKLELIQAGAEIVELSGSGGAELEFILDYLAQREEINDLLLESGPRLAGAVLSANRLDELIIYMAPHLLGHKAQELLYLDSVNSMTDKIELHLQEARSIGPDLRLTYSVANAGMVADET